ncbi:MAG TPA: deoxyribodipyrimidine photo-lyase [Verrucomicrobiae bacterium]|jgi:deoxyribodipyrimidine photo-lyase|nr:deoxyribodipyrimidine photo-lyase [Verrucomicrobiae bacterium]
MGVTRAASLVWFRLDLRLSDHLALRAAAQRGAVIPVFIFAPEEEAPWEPGAASRWWLHQSLQNLDAALRNLGSRLVIRRGPSLTALRNLIRETGATAVFWNRRYEPALIARDEKVAATLRADGVEVETSNSALLHEPWEIKNQSGKPFQVFTPYWRHCLAQVEPAAPLAAPRQLPPPSAWPDSVALDSLGLPPKIPWAAGLAAAWEPGERGARQQLRRFLADALENYDDGRNRPDLAGTSRLSPHLHFGEISPRQIWGELKARAERAKVPAPAWRAAQFVSELGWREFAHHLLYHFPHTTDQPLRGGFAQFPWRQDAAGLRAWQRGRTGFPIVDAGMRELWATGWMHNRVRMIAASFLTKDLLLPWQAGARWFWDTLVDADLANNTLGWQWTAGCGADAAPFFRIFNPISQGEKFDPQGRYVRRWIPELAPIPVEALHQPWQAGGARAYPERILNHALARQEALAAYAKIKSVS